MDDNIEERFNDEGYFINRDFDSEEGYRILHRLGLPPSMNANGMGVGEYDGNFYSEMTNNAKVNNENNENNDNNENDDEEEEINPEKYELNNGDKNMVGYISNELYYPIKKDKKEVELKKNEKLNGIMEMNVGELFENTSMVLNNFDDEYLRALHMVDMKFGYSASGNGLINNIKRYFLAFIVYLQEGNNILYIGIVLFIISIILYFINIIRKND